MSRFDYVAYDGAATAFQNKAKEKAKELEAVIDLLSNGRAKALAMTALEECYMWIGKAVRDDQIARVGQAPLQEGRKNG